MRLHTVGGHCLDSLATPDTHSDHAPRPAGPPKRPLTSRGDRSGLGPAVAVGGAGSPDVASESPSIGAEFPLSECDANRCRRLARAADRAVPVELGRLLAVTGRFSEVSPDQGPHGRRGGKRPPHPGDEGGAPLAPPHFALPVPLGHPRSSILGHPTARIYPETCLERTKPASEPFEEGCGLSLRDVVAPRLHDLGAVLLQCRTAEHPGRNGSPWDESERSASGSFGKEAARTRESRHSGPIFLLSPHGPAGSSTTAENADRAVL